MGRDPLRILLVDDDESYAMLVRAALGTLTDIAGRYELIVLSDGPVAVDYILGQGAYAEDTDHAGPDIVLLDQRMRTMDGTDVLRKIRASAHDPCVPICIMSTSDQRRQQQECYALGAALCITKPMELERLQRKLELLVKFATEVLELPQAA